MKKVIVISFCIIALMFAPAMACKGSKGNDGNSSGESLSDSDIGQNSSETSGASRDADRSRDSGESNKNGPNELPCDILINGPDCEFGK